MYDLINIFETFLPQLLLYPNPKSPLNVKAALYFEKKIGKFESEVHKLVEKYALKKGIK